MTIIQSVVLGLVQGITEFLPISSSGHLVFVPKFFGWADQGLFFDLIVHLGTLGALIIFLKGRLGRIVHALFHTHSRDHTERELALFIGIATVPALVAGFFLNDLVAGALRSPLLVAINLIIWGIVLWLADLYSRAQHSFGKIKPLAALKTKNALTIGLAQALALVPGVSRSGITITAGLFSKLDKVTATEFSFLLSVPIIALAGLGKLFLLLKETGTIAYSVPELTSGFFASLIGGLAALWFLTEAIKKWSFLPFAIYRVVVGILILLFLI